MEDQGFGFRPPVPGCVEACLPSFKCPAQQPHALYDALPARILSPLIHQTPMVCIQPILSLKGRLSACL